MKPSAHVVFSAVMLLVSGCASFAAQPGDAANALLETVLEKDGGPGVMAAVVKDGKIVWSGEAGMADLEQHVPMSPGERLRIGSVSKPITAMLALIAAQRGELNLDADIRTYVPEFGEKKGVVTVRRLASHTAGVRHYDFSNYLEANNVFYRVALADGLQALVSEPLVAPPGEKFEYSSLGYNLIGAAIERATEESFADALHTRLTGPLKLADTLPDNPVDIIENRSGFYTVTMKNPAMTWMEDEKVINTIMRDSSDYYPSGGMLSTARDLARFAYEAFNNDLVRDESRAMMTTPANLNNGEVAQLDNGIEVTPYTFGWQIRAPDEEAPLSYGHNGETNGAYALVRYYPDRKLSVAAIANYNTIGETTFFETLGETLPALFFKAD